MDLALRSGEFPDAAKDLFAKSGAAVPHSFTGAVHERKMGPTITYQSKNFRHHYGNPVGAPTPLDSSWTRTCQERE